MMTSCSKQNVDRLSKLPEEILWQILSLMPTKFAVRTSVLSKRWRYAWTFATNLDFYEVRPCEASFPEFVDGILKRCKTSQITLFRLHLPYGTTAQSSSVSSWIDKAVRLDVRQLHITIYERNMYELPLSLFTCNTLTELTLIHNFPVFSCPVKLPSLRILHITGCRVTLGCAIKFVRGSPMLESLSLEVPSEFIGFDYTFNIPTLKRFQLKLYGPQGHPEYETRVILNAPNLENLIADQYPGPSFVMDDVSSLVEASISSRLRGSNNHMWVALLNGVRQVKKLSFGIIPPTTFLPIFPNLKRLELKCGWRLGRIKIFQFLECCPKLQHLYIEEHVGSGLRNPKSVPACLLTNLTTIKFSNCKGSKSDIQFLGYLPGNAKALKMVTISWDKSRIKEEERVCDQLLKRKRASRCCEIQFHGN